MDLPRPVLGPDSLRARQGELPLPRGRAPGRVALDPADLRPRGRDAGAGAAADSWPAGPAAGLHRAAGQQGRGGGRGAGRGAGLRAVLAGKGGVVTGAAL